MTMEPLDVSPEPEIEEPRVVGREWDNVDWQDDAACRGEGHELFFGPAAERPEPREAREAFVKDAYCSTCPVRIPCRDFARRHREYGLWAETELERIAAGFVPDMPIGTSARLATLMRRGLIAR